METKKLCRTEGMLGGVCAGIAKYLNIDPTVVRLITVAATVLTGSLFLWAYLIAWAIMPKEA